jgi:hypothetical protein
MRIPNRYTIVFVDLDTQQQFTITHEHEGLVIDGTEDVRSVVGLLRAIAFRLALGRRPYRRELRQLMRPALAGRS